jgi:hypothetical protein
MIKFESFLPEILTYFGNAELIAADLRQRTLSLCGKQVRIVYSSEILEISLFKAFEHLENIENSAAPEFQIFVCDGNVLNRDLPGWEKLEELSGKEKKILMYNAGDIHALYNADSQVFSLVDTASGRGWYYLPKAADLPYYEKAAPMRMLLHWWCEMSGRVLVHAAAVGWDSRAVLLAGRGGTGKSTTAILAAQSGFNFLGDDYVVLDNVYRPAVLSAYNSVKFRWEMIERLSSAETLSVNDPDADEKGYFYLYQTHRNSLIKTLPLKAVLLPTLEQQSKTTFTRLPSTRGLLGLAASSIFQMPGSGKQTLKKLADILRDTPVYQMSLGTDNAEIVESLKKFLSGTES